MASPARIFPTYATHPLDESSGVLDMKELFALLNDMAKWSLNNTAVTLAHTGGGTANALACESTPAISAYAADQLFWLVPAATNTGAVTIEIDGLATRAVVDKAGDALTGGELVTGNAYLMWDNGTHIRNMTPDASAGGGSTASFSKIVDAVSLSGAAYSQADFDHDEAYIFMDDAEPSGTNTALRLRFSDDNGSTDETSGYVSWTGSETGFAGIHTGNQWDNGTPRGFYIHIIRSGTEMVVDAYMSNNTRKVSYFDNGNDVDALKLYPDSGTFSGGTITIWAK